MELTPEVKAALEKINFINRYKVCQGSMPEMRPLIMISYSVTDI